VSFMGQVKSLKKGKGKKGKKHSSIRSNRDITREEKHEQGQNATSAKLGKNSIPFSSNQGRETVGEKRGGRKPYPARR